MTSSTVGSCIWVSGWRVAFSIARSRWRSRGRDEGDRVAAAARAAGAADAVHVGLGVGGDVVVDDVADPLDVEAAGRDVGGDEDVELAGLELVDGALALHLRDVAVDGHRGVAAGAQLLGERLGLVLGADEDDHALEVLDLEDAGEGVDLLRVGHDQVALGDRGDRRGLVLDGDLDRVLEVLLRDAADLRAASSRRTARRACLSGVSARIVSTSSAKPIFSISSASSRTRKRSSREVEGALLEVVHDAAGRADDDVHAAAQRRELHAVALAAVDRQHVHALHVGGVLLEGLRDLERELAGRGQDEGLRRLLGEVESRQDRQRERGRLAGAGLGEADDVAALEERRDGRRLDLRRGLVAHVGQRLEDLGREAEVGEGLLGLVGLVVSSLTPATVGPHGGIGHSPGATNHANKRATARRVRQHTLLMSSTMPTEPGSPRT